MNFIIGIDIGTTHVKAVVAGPDGRTVFETKKGYPTSNPSPGYHEQDAEEIFQAVLGVLKPAVASVEKKENIACVSFSAAMHSLLAVDANGVPLMPMMTWADTRSNAYAILLKSLPVGQTIYRQTGTPIHPMSPLCKIRWLKEEKPDLFARSARFISGKEYIFYRLFGEWIVDYSIASATGLFDIHHLTWCRESLDFAGITEENLSRPCSTLFALNGLKKEYGELLGIPASVPFLAGASDGCLSNIGAGAIYPYELALTIGTSGAVRVLSPHPVADDRQRLFNYVLDEKTYLCGGGINNGGNVIKWFVNGFMEDELAEEEKMNRLLAGAAAIHPGSDGLIFLPYLYGERAPVWDASAKGVFLGIGPQHSRYHFMRSVMEGISFSLRQVIHAMEEKGEKIEVVFANGGFIQSTLWLRIMADVLGKKISVSRAGDASAIGAIFIAMKYLGQLKEWAEVKSMTSLDEEYIPDPAMHHIYNSSFEIFTDLYEKLKDDFKRIDQLQTMK